MYPCLCYSTYSISPLLQPTFSGYYTSSYNYTIKCHTLAVWNNISLAKYANTQVVTLLLCHNGRVLKQILDSKIVIADTQQEEAPPIIPYRGDPYTEVARTGLFGTDTATPEQRGLPEVVMANSPAYAEVRQPQVCQIIIVFLPVQPTTCFE